MERRQTILLTADDLSLENFKMEEKQMKTGALQFHPKMCHFD